MTWASTECGERFEILLERLPEEINRNRFDVALRLCAEALSLAESAGDREAVDCALYMRGVVRVAQGRGDEVVGLLRRILMRTACPANGYRAAYTISLFHDHKKEYPRSLFYARLALDHAEKTSKPEFVARCHNRIANLLLLDSHFPEACKHYEDALTLQEIEPSVDRALILSNTGYGKTVMGCHTEGFRLLFSSLRMLRRLGARSLERLPRLGLAYAYIEIGRPERARDHAETALELSEQAASEEHLKNSLYLLGEAEKLCGNEVAAYEHFARLQDEYYPAEPFVADLLMATDIRKLINLMA